MCHRRRAMDELGATLRRISKFLRRQREYTSTASVSRLEDGHLFARACKLAGGHQARSARANDQKMGDGEGHQITKPLSGTCGSTASLMGGSTNLCAGATGRVQIQKSE